MIRRALLIASAVFAAIACAGPGAASANWTENQEPLTANATVDLSGPFSWQIPGVAGIEATIHVGIELEAGTTTGKVVSFSDTSCNGTIAFAGLSCTGTARDVNIPAQPTKWRVDVVKGDIVIRNVDLLIHYYIGPHSGAPVRQSVMSGDIIATPDDPEAIGTVTLSESTNTTMNGVPGEVNGDLLASPEGVFGF